MRIVDIDYCMMKPHPLLDHVESNVSNYSSLINVPVIRIFGATEWGQKACVHIHQVFFTVM